MLQQVIIHSSKDFDFMEYSKLLGVKKLVLSISPEEIPDAWGFYRDGQSTTLFSIERGEGIYVLSMDGMASYEDYGFFPYLIDTLSTYLCDCPYRSEDGKSAFQTFDEEWTEYCIGEEVAYLKCLLSIGQSYEEGWVDAPDLDTAMIWFNKAAAVGHHLAIKRLTTNENETQY